MKVTITFKLTPESRDEMIATFGGQYREFREIMEIFAGKNGFGPAEKVEMRWLVESGRWE
jgi:hypothetical protein